MWRNIHFLNVIIRQQEHISFLLLEVNVRLNLQLIKLQSYNLITNKQFLNFLMKYKQCIINLVQPGFTLKSMKSNNELTVEKPLFHEPPFNDSMFYSE